MPRDYQLYIQDIIVSCEKILRYTRNMSEEQFFQDERTYDAVLRHLMIIGEAAKNIPEDFRVKFKHIEWRKICGVRDIVTHVYFGIDNVILWDIIKTKIPILLNDLKNPKV